ncbi:MULTISPECIES: hypothetical protein [Asticcacaulis]|uniref:hypothetical protein n=1 Tax=Asticcacaulis TaxID=76890 RepID=UPI001AE4A709|nr:MULTISPECIES: hypothetical protein [Asticcacaulis]MBP2160375.1 hypothetical protein [Asticcacaulis solisilvae]MDR6801322.1 hypothetical protein [Asticcacaulis sp. BE141]
MRRTPYAHTVMTAPTLALTAAIEALYAEFKRPQPRRIDGCPCCWDESDYVPLTTTPLRALTDQQLSNYSASVFLTAGGLGDYKYFLPRVFELAVTEKDWWPDTEVVLGKLKLAEWQYWPEDEHRVVQTFVDAWFDALATQAAPPEDGIYYCPPIDGLLCGMAWAGIGLEPYLKRLLDHPAALADLYYSNAQTMSDKDRLFSGFWDDVDPAVITGVKAYLRSDAVLDALTR